MTNVKIIQKQQNEGLVLARLTAMLRCTGDYIAVLDSDDYVADDYYETYMKIIQEHDADVCLCPHQDVEVSTQRCINVMKEEKDIQLQGDDCFNYICSYDAVKDGYITLWSKIFKKELFKNVQEELYTLTPQLKGIVGGEDSLYNVMLFSKAQKVISGKGSYYYYCRHEEQSVVSKTKTKLLSNFECHLRSNNLARKFAQKNNIYERYINFDYWWLSYSTAQYFNLALKNKCLDEFNQLMKQYDADKNLKIINYTKKVLQEKQ